MDFIPAAIFLEKWLMLDDLRRSKLDMELLTHPAFSFIDESYCSMDLLI